MTLPNTSAGHSRFCLDATTNPIGGGTLTRQFSVWEWDGREAAPKLIRPYQASGDTRGVTVAGSLIKIGVKQELRTFFSCGQCTEPEGIWTLLVTSDGVQDLGTMLLEPAYTLLDDLFLRILRREDVTDIASGAVAARLRNVLPTVNGREDGAYLVGMLGKLRRTRQNGRDVVCDACDRAHHLRRFFVGCVEQRHPLHKRPHVRRKPSVVSCTRVRMRLATSPMNM